MPNTIPTKRKAVPLSSTAEIIRPKQLPEVVGFSAATARRLELQDRFPRIPSLAPVHARKVAELYHKRHVVKQTMQTIAELETLTPAEIAKKYSDS